MLLWSWGCISFVNPENREIFFLQSDPLLTDPRALSVPLFWIFWECLWIWVSECKCSNVKHFMMECYVFLMRMKVGACLIHVACLYPRKMLRTNKTPNFSAWILTMLFSVSAFWTIGDPFSLCLNCSRLPKLNTANHRKEKLISKISRELRLCFTLFQTQSYIF